MSADNYYVILRTPTRTRQGNEFEYRVGSQQSSQYFDGHLFLFTEKENVAWRKAERKRQRAVYRGGMPQNVIDEIRFGERILYPGTDGERCVWLWYFWSENTQIYQTHREALARAFEMERDFASEYGINDQTCGIVMPTREEAQAAATRAGEIWIRLFKMGNEEKQRYSL